MTERRDCEGAGPNGQAGGKALEAGRGGPDGDAARKKGPNGPCRERESIRMHNTTRSGSGKSRTAERRAALVARLLAGKPARLSAAALGALAAIPVVGHVVAPDAAAECNPQNPDINTGYERGDNNIHYFAGWVRDFGTNTVGGTRASVRNPDVWVHSGSFSTGFAMLAKPPPVGERYGWWAQLGWIERPGNVRETFLQYSHADRTWETVEPDTLPRPSLDEGPLYEVEYFPASGPSLPRFEFRMNGGRVGPVVNAEFTPTQAQQFGEIESLATQMPGGTQSHVYIRLAEVRTLSGAYKAFNPTYYGAFIEGSGSADQYFGTQMISDKEIQIWDKSCYT